ncbi:hypothetical protein [Streptomyces sp. SBT349]|uniref:hypothetical protein n=1 Tax=Streptomyces sp. SBT349 TaxID=1580539 RepID=UPI00069D56DE|nr:hypothetical protein [Streptomyces sp. SBT349]
MPEAAHAVQVHEDGATHWLYDLAGQGWTAAVRRDGAGRGVLVRRAGGRELWGEFPDVYARWQGLGAPGVERFGLTVAADGAVAPWLDAPGRPVSS